MSTAVFLGPGGQDPVAAIHQLRLAFAPTVGDALVAGQILRSRIVQRTQAGVDVDGAPFAPYSTKGPYYFYADPEVAHLKSRKERLTTIGNRFSAIGKKGARTRVGRQAGVGIRYDGGYAEAHAALGGGSAVDLFGMVHHKHMMKAMLVKAGGLELDQDSGPLDAFAYNAPCNQLHVGFYDETEPRARGHNEGAGHLPRRHFFDASADDLEIMTKAMADRMLARANSLSK